jgi:two-component system, NarL family, sensor kinase
MLSSYSEVVYTAIAGVFLMLFLSAMTILSVIRYNNKLMKHEQEKNDLKVNFSQTLLQSQLEIQEQTLKNISQEIHDNVGQVLTLAKLNLATTVVTDGLAAENIKTTQQLIAKAINDLRDLSRSLNTDYVQEMGLVRSIEYELELLKKTGTIETALNIQGKIVKLERQKELILFRIVQEAIHNIMKHAEAKTIEVAIQFMNETISIFVKDDGRGFDVSPLNDEGNRVFGLGLRNMHNRATLIGAKFSVTSILQQGTEVYISLPINGDTDERATKN